MAMSSIPAKHRACAHVLFERLKITQKNFLNITLIHQIPTVIKNKQPVFYPHTNQAIGIRHYNYAENEGEKFIYNMARVMATKESLEKALRDESKPWTKVFAMAESKTGVDRFYIFIAAVAFLALYLVIGIGQQLVCNVIGFIYPAYCSMKALETRQKDDDTKWLTYWVVFAVFTIIESFSDYIVGWFPVYWLFKCVFYVWLMAPMEYNGSLVIYDRFVRPKFLKYQPGVDTILENARDAVVRSATDALKKD